MTNETVLEVRGVSKSFPGVQALDNVNLEIKRHEILGLVGENGAGKSTLLKILSGVYSADSGKVFLRGQEVKPRSVKEARLLGIAMVFQEQSLLPNLSVRENLFLGDEEPFLRWGVIDWKKMDEVAKQQLQKVGSDIDPRAYTADLSFAQRQMVEIAKAMVLEERVAQEPIIILDEPTSVLEREEVEQLFVRLRRLRERASIIFISHRLDEVLEITDRVYILKDGRNVAMFNTADTNVSQIHQLMVGRELKGEYYREADQADYGEEVVMRMEHLSKWGAFRDVSFELHKGEILGISGVLGSGREELCRCLCGAERADSGRILVDGKPVTISSPMQAIQHGIGYVPMERRTEGLILYMSVAPNITLASLEKVIRMGLLDYGLEANVAREWIGRLRIKTPSHRALCLNLSGGNQQKIVLAKWLASQVKILILDHPTRGLDVGAKEEVYELIRELAKRGISVVLIGDTLEEIIGLSNTILTMRDGRVQMKFDAPRGNKPSQLDLIRQIT